MWIVLKRKLLLMEGDITRIESGLSCNIVELIGFMGTWVSKKHIFGSTRREFITMSMKSLCITEASKHTKMIIRWFAGQ